MLPFVKRKCYDSVMSNVIPMPGAKGATTPLDLFLRVGENHYGQIANLYAEGRVPLRRAIIDASRLRHQLNFVKTLRENGVELSLDPKTAELAALNRFEGKASGTPWSDGTLHLPTQFDRARCRQLVSHIAREAIEKQFDRVLSPTHFLKEGVLDPWFQIDMQLCRLLREALDQEGGAHIAIDYVVIVEQLKLRDEAVRAVLLSQLAHLPFENVIFRISHFGADATATGIRTLITLLERFHNFGHPVVIDHVGGLVGRALLAFGVAGGIAHGLDEHLRFDATPWNRPLREPEPDEEDEGRKGGTTKRIAIPLFDRTFTVAELTSLARAKHGRLVVCQDPNCCRSLADMIDNSKRHSITQEARAMDALNKTPDLMRTQHFLDVELAAIDRFGRQVKDLKPVVSELKPRKGQTAEQAAEKLVRRITEHAQRNEKMRSSLENLHSVRGLDSPRAPAAHLSQRIRDYNRKHSS
jgi:hypothetical protein